ncbi:MAG: cyclic nucleotide-binding domain-containing protein [Deltaproteobacteria bacterium]|nr:cyclic nucleotide-binding domain-containing protein [Deltaproteobacteria bacterium]
MEALEQLLAEHPFLQGLPSRHLSRLVDFAEAKQFDAQQFLFREGEAAREFFLIRSGQVAMEIYTARRGAITIQTRQAGDVLGWMGLKPPYQWNVDARAMTVVRVITLKVEGLWRLCEEDHELGYDLLKRHIGCMAQYFKSMKLQLVSLVHGV